MIQYKTTVSEVSAIDTIQSLIAKGAQWIRLVVSSDVNDATFDAITEICKEACVILTIEDDFEKLKQIHCHGIHLNPGTVHPKIIRDELGAEPIIGVSVKTPAEVIALKGSDVDYAQVMGDTPTQEWYSDFAKAVHDANIDIKLVAPIDNINMDEINNILNAGIDGVVYTV